MDDRPCKHPMPPITNQRIEFWRVWHEEDSARKTMMTQGRLNWKELTASYKRINKYMPYAPHAWIRKLCQHVDWHECDNIHAQHKWVYMMWTMYDPRPYFGPCGAMGHPRAMIIRFADEVVGTKSCGKVYAGKKRKVPLYIHLLWKLGPPAFSVIPMRRTPTYDTSRTVMWNIRHVTPNINTVHSRRRRRTTAGWRAVTYASAYHKLPSTTPKHGGTTHRCNLW